MYFPPDGLYPSESVSHLPQPALLPASLHCRMQPQPSSSPPASLDYSRIAPPPKAIRQRVSHCIWISSSQSPQPTIHHSTSPYRPYTIVLARQRASKILLKQPL